MSLHLVRSVQALQDNNTPYIDHGIETLYRFAGKCPVSSVTVHNTDMYLFASAFDPFVRSSYFGVLRDLGQFER